MIKKLLLISSLIIILISFIIYFILQKKQNNENFINNQEPVYLFWTGGYDSTARLCQLVIEQQIPVQPIYIDFNLDNQTYDQFWVRKNRKQEKKAMNNIIKKIIKKYPNFKNLIYPIKFIRDKHDNPEFTKMFNKMNLFPRKRRIHQYLYLSQYAYNLKKFVEIGVLGIHKNSKFANFLQNNLVDEGNNYRIRGENPMKYIKFPLYNQTKEDILNRAILNNYDDILLQSWSCWFPKNGKPCKRCPMCKERIVKHPDNIEHFKII